MFAIDVAHGYGDRIPDLEDLTPNGLLDFLLGTTETEGSETTNKEPDANSNNTKPIKDAKSNLGAPHIKLFDSLKTGDIFYNPRLGGNFRKDKGEAAMTGLALVIANGHGSPFRSSIAQTTLLITLVFLLNSVFLCCALIRPKLVMKILFGLFHVATMIILIYLLFIMAKEGFTPAQILMYLWALAIVYSWFRVGLNVIRLS